MRIKTGKLFLALLNISVIFIACVSPVTAQQGNTQVDTPYTESTAFYILGLLLFTLAVLFAVIMIFDIKEREPVLEKAAALKDKKKKILIDEAALLMDHDYDGIRELDNKLPAWFQFLFYGSILIAIVYMVNYHVLGKQNLMLDEYAEEMMLAQQQKEELMKSGALINETNVTLLNAPEDIQKGKEIFTANCLPCHGANGEGTVGPNLTDDYWIHGGGIKNVFVTIRDGVPVKGMISWKTTLNPKQMQQTASFILTLKGTKPPNGKPPEGNIWVDSTAINNKIKTDSTVKNNKVKTDTVTINKMVKTESIKINNKEKSDSTKKPGFKKKRRVR